MEAEIDDPTSSLIEDDDDWAKRKKIFEKFEQYDEEDDEYGEFDGEEDMEEGHPEDEGVSCHQQ
jgi:hypothetical protein